MNIGHGKIIEVSIGGFVIECDYKARMINLNDFLKVANEYRRSKRKLVPASIVRSTKFKELAEAILEYKNQELWNLEEVHAQQTGACLFEVRVSQKDFTMNDIFYIKDKVTYCHINLIVDIAMLMNAKFKNMVIEEFVNGKILEVRDDGRQSYIDLEIAITKISDGSEARDSSIRITQAMRKAMGIENFIGWNDARVTKDMQDFRVKTNESLIKIVEAGINDLGLFIKLAETNAPKYK